MKIPEDEIQEAREARSKSEPASIWEAVYISAIRVRVFALDDYLPRCFMNHDDGYGPQEVGPYFGSGLIGLHGPHIAKSEGNGFFLLFRVQ